VLLLFSFPNNQLLVGSDFRVLLQGLLPTTFPNVGKKVRSLAASVLFYIPVVREISLFTGCISATRSVATKALERGQSLLVLPGGEAEQLLTKHGVELIYLKHRKGFVKLAMKNNTFLVPVYVFGCNDLFVTKDTFYKQRHWIMKKFGICLPLAKGVLGSWCPLQVDQTVVFGDPIRFKNYTDVGPTEEEVNVAHEQFTVAIKKLFDENKKQCGYADRELIIV